MAFPNGFDVMFVEIMQRELGGNKLSEHLESKQVT